jgi:hypothetical protein
MRAVALIPFVLLWSCTGGRELSKMSTGGASESTGGTQSATSSESASTHRAGQSTFLGVHVSMRGSNPVFQVKFECGEQPIAPDVISVSDPNYHGSEPRFYCLLRDDPVPGSRPNYARNWEWEYGIKAPGYRLQGPCAPLERGRKYDVGADGPGTGNTIFAINQDGTIQVYEDDCQRVKNRKGTNP